MLKKHTGRSFTQILTEAKMDCATKMLQHWDISVQAISDQLGYNESAHFMKVFKKHYGCTPTQYRNQSSGNSSNESSEISA
jgi:AraC-like DNA-binding protein